MSEGMSGWGCPEFVWGNVPGEVWGKLAGMFVGECPHAGLQNSTYSCYDLCHPG